MTKTFTCEACGETFESGRTDEEAMEEAEKLHGDDLGDDPALVCTDCFHRLMGAH